MIVSAFAVASPWLQRSKKRDKKLALRKQFSALIAFCCASREQFTGLRVTDV
jgi:hypothetical protein